MKAEEQIIIEGWNFSQGGVPFRLVPDKTRVLQPYLVMKLEEEKKRVEEKGDLVEFEGTVLARTKHAAKLFLHFGDIDLRKVDESNVDF